MKKLALIFTLLFSTVVFSSTSFAGWTKMAVVKDGSTYYVDFERIRKRGGYVYYWDLQDLLKPNSEFLSGQRYIQGDCKLFRYKILSVSVHKEPMGGGTGRIDNKPDKEWSYPAPNTVNETILKLVCSR